jgi:RimJ/RimL family protein N-acetyltransferase
VRLAPRERSTARLRLLSARPEHAAAWLACLNASIPAWRFIEYGQSTRELPWSVEFCTRAQRFVDDGEALIFHAFEPASGACIGRIDLHSFDFQTPRGEIGYLGDPRFSGRGLMREAVQAVCGLGFELGLARIEAMSDTRNHRAIHFALGLGFTHEGVLRCHERDPQGGLCDVALLALVHKG